MVWKTGAKDAILLVYERALDLLLPLYYDHTVAFSLTALVAGFVLWPFLAGVATLGLVIWVASSFVHVSIAFSLYNSLMKTYKYITRYISFIISSYRSLKVYVNPQKAKRE